MIGFGQGPPTETLPLPHKRRNGNLVSLRHLAAENGARRDFLSILPLCIRGNASRKSITRRIASTMLDQFVETSGLPGAKHNASFSYRFAPFLIRHANYCNLFDRGMQHQGLFHFARIKSPAGNDHVLLAIRQTEAILVEADASGVKPSMSQHLQRQLMVVPIADMLPGPPMMISRSHRPRNPSHRADHADLTDRRMPARLMQGARPPPHAPPDVGEAAELFRSTLPLRPTCAKIGPNFAMVV